MGRFSYIRSLVRELFSDLLSELEQETATIFDKIKQRYFKDV